MLERNVSAYADHPLFLNMPNYNRSYIIAKGLSLLSFLPMQFENTNDVVPSNHPGSHANEEGNISLSGFTSYGTVALQDLLLHT